MRKLTKLACLLGLLAVVFGVINSGCANAELKFQSTQQMQFTINSTVSLDISSELSIPNLVPGTNTDSNEISVSVTTNAAGGYYLMATSGTSSTDTDLVNESNNAYRFHSLDPSEELSDMSEADDNQWGYAFKVDNGNYSEYSGLPLDDGDIESGATLINTSRAAESRVVKFKIGAKAAADQVFGNYSNVINFYIVTYPAPEEKTIDDIEYMQEFKTLSSHEKTTVLASMGLNEQYQLKDSRDEKTYYVAKLIDGNVWMTQNLDHDIDNNAVYIPNNTDIRNDWEPNAYIHDVSDEEWEGDGYSPELYNPGDLCWNGTIDIPYSGMAEDTTIPCSQYDNDHYRIGNYYSWAAAVAMNDTSDYVENLEDVDQSICPAGWRLPVYEGDKSYSNLVTGLNSTSGMDGNIQNAPAYLVYGDLWEGDVSNYLVGAYGAYWTSIVLDNRHADSLLFSYASELSGQVDNFRESGLSVRCVLR